MLLIAKRLRFVKSVGIFSYIFFGSQTFYFCGCYTAFILYRQCLHGGLESRVSLCRASASRLWPPHLGQKPLAYLVPSAGYSFCVLAWRNTRAGVRSVDISQWARDPCIWLAPSFKVMIKTLCWYVMLLTLFFILFRGFLFLQTWWTLLSSSV